MQYCSFVSKQNHCWGRKKEDRNSFENGGCVGVQSKDRKFALILLCHKIEVV